MPRIRSTNSGGRVIRGYLKLDFAHFLLGGVATVIRVLGIYRLVIETKKDCNNVGQTTIEHFASSKQ